MHLRKTITTVATMLAMAVGAGSAMAEPTEIQWWHAMGGLNGERVNRIANDFNATQSDYKVVPGTPQSRRSWSRCSCP